MKQNSREKSLLETSRYLKDAEERHRRILEATERNSVIAGLPRFTIDFSSQLKKNLELIAACQQ